MASIPLNANTQMMMLEGKAGQIECAFDLPFDGAAINGIAVVSHPNPQHGGSMDNKVVHTIARALVQRGFVTWRYNYRGVGSSEGAWDNGVGETDDLLSVIDQACHSQNNCDKPLLLAGFSFGGYVTAKAIVELQKVEQAVQNVILVGVATGMYIVPEVPSDTLVIHGECDDVIPLKDVMDWCRPQHIPVTVVPGVGHFFHGQLPLLKEIILRDRLGLVGEQA